MSNNKDSVKLYFIFCDHKLVLTDNLEFPTTLNPFIKNAQFIRKVPLDFTSSSHYAAELNTDETLPPNLQLVNLRELYYALPTEIMELAGKARQLIEWDKSNQFCGECGSQTSPAAHEHNRTCINKSCQHAFYPRITPVVIVAVERGQEILLARSPHFPAEIYSTLAGFVEPGESIEQCAHREVFEETGIKIKNLRYFSSQPWPFPSSLILGFQADYDSGNIICAPNEIEDAAFFHINSLPKIYPGKVTISQLLIQDFCQKNKG